jgi:hypothetical protein
LFPTVGNSLWLWGRASDYLSLLEMTIKSSAISKDRPRSRRLRRLSLDDLGIPFEKAGKSSQYTLAGQIRACQPPGDVSFSPTYQIERNGKE